MQRPKVGDEFGSLKAEKDQKANVACIFSTRRNVGGKHRPGQGAPCRSCKSSDVILI